MLLSISPNSQQNKISVYLQKQAQAEFIFDLANFVVFLVSLDRSLIFFQTNQYLIQLQAMEGEEHYFYQSERDFFGEYMNLNPFQYNSEAQYVQRKNSTFASDSKNANLRQESKATLQAYNPLERLKHLPQDKHYFMHMFNNHKGLNGIQHFFSLAEQDQNGQEFMENIESDALRDNSMGNFQLDKLFDGRQSRPHRQEMQKHLDLLSKRMQQINQKTIGSINLNKTVTQSFYEHFQNFSLIFGQSSFLEEFQDNFKGMIANCKKIKGPGIGLFQSIYEFWMKSFKDFVSQIGKYSSKFTLNFFKKSAPEMESSNNCSSNSELKSESSNTIGSKEKRKGWSKEQIERIQRCINENIIFTQSVLKNLATQLGRSSSSIASKVQKLIKTKKGEQAEQDSLMKKTIQILQMNNQGLTRETIIEKLNENYEMGYGGQWQKSVGQLLSSQKDFIKIRGKHRLTNPHLYQPLGLQSEERSVLTFKDKVVQIFLTMPNFEADLKTLCQKYCAMFGQVELEGQMAKDERKKTIQGNISKTLSRYDIFDNSNAKTKYLLNPLLNKTEQRDMDLEVSDYFTL